MEVAPVVRMIVDSFLRLENRHTGEILRMRRVHDARGQIVLTLDGVAVACVFFDIRRFGPCQQVLHNFFQPLLLFLHVPIGVAPWP